MQASGLSSGAGELAIIADTHALRLPESCLARMRGARHVIHAGDIVSLDSWRALEALGVPLTAVRGNCDEPALARLLPETAELALDDLRIAVIHDAGPARGRLTRLRRRFTNADLVVFGHSHIPLLEQESDFAIFNPGSATQRRRQPACTMGARDSRGVLSLIQLC